MHGIKSGEVTISSRIERSVERIVADGFISGSCEKAV